MIGQPMKLRPLYAECRKRKDTHLAALIYTLRYRPQIWSMKMRGKYLHPGKLMWHCLNCDEKRWLPFGTPNGTSWHDCS